MATRYVALLRGVSPTNCKMSELKRAFEAAGFTEVKTVLGSGNVVFNARARSEAAVARTAEAAMREHLGQGFYTLVRTVQYLRTLLASDPYSRFQLKPGSKRVVTFLTNVPARLPRFPVELDDARILTVAGREAFTTYVPGPKGPAFMTLLEKTFGKDITTRTWDTVAKLAR